MLLFAAFEHASAAFCERLASPLTAFDATQPALVSNRNKPRVKPLIELFATVLSQYFKIGDTAGMTSSSYVSHLQVERQKKSRELHLSSDVMISSSPVSSFCHSHRFRCNTLQVLEPFESRFDLAPPGAASEF